LWALGYLTLLATVVTTYVQTRFQRDTTPTRAAIIYTIEPVWASLLGYALLQESLGVLGILGGGLIIAGILVSEASPSNDH
jgi:drug/metabolite transporter (DMT)-like permease